MRLVSYEADDLSMTDYDDKVLQQQEAIRQSGLTNMFDKNRVKEIAEQMGSDELAEFIENADAEEYIEMAEEAREQMGLK
jgi:Mg/Co/Ni transporter MgtE